MEQQPAGGAGRRGVHPTVCGAVHQILANRLVRSCRLYAGGNTSPSCLPETFICRGVEDNMYVLCVHSEAGKGCGLVESNGGDRTARHGELTVLMGQSGGYIPCSRSEVSFSGLPAARVPTRRQGSHAQNGVYWPWPELRKDLA